MKISLNKRLDKIVRIDENKRRFKYFVVIFSLLLLYILFFVNSGLYISSVIFGEAIKITREINRRTHSTGTRFYMLVELNDGKVINVSMNRRDPLLKGSTVEIQKLEKKGGDSISYSFIRYTQD